MIKKLLQIFMNFINKIINIFPQHKKHSSEKMSIKQIDGYKIRMNQRLGSGSYGSVYVGQTDGTHKKVAIKILPKSSIDSDDYLKSALFQQIKIMQTVKNPNVVQFIDVMQSSKNYYIIQELCDGDITQLLKPGKQFPQNDCINMLTQICNGFLALVREGIVHRDLKPANVMIKDNILKIGDFGFAKQLVPNKSIKIKSIVGTPLYMSLQILKSQDYTSKCDIWALGFIFYEMLHGTTPWTAKSEYQLVKNIETKPLKIRRHDLHPNTVDFLKRCLAIKQCDRISWDELFLHPIFQGFFDDKGTNKTFENKLKQIMNELRFYIKSNNLDLSKILYSLGYRDQNQELDFEEYFRFLKIVNKNIKKQEALYVFKQTDTDNSNSISIYQIEQILRKHAISFTSTFRGIPKFNKEQKQQQTFSMMPQSVQRKIQNCFTKLYKIIQKNKISLSKVFKDFDKKNDKRLSEKQFMNMMSKLDKDMPEEQIMAAFRLIDEDNSKTIQFDQLNKYYSKVNGIPEQFSQEMNEPMDVEYPSTNQHIPKQQLINPLFKLQHKNTFPQQQFQQPNMYYPPPNNVPPQQPQGLFGNFIMNQLAQNMHGSNQPPYQQQNMNNSTNYGRRW